MSAQNEEEDEMIEKIDQKEVLVLFEILRIDIEQVVDAILQTRKSGLVPVSVGMKHPELTVMGVPIVFEENANDEIVVYSQDKKAMN